jgi:hypothetical protein
LVGLTPKWKKPFNNSKGKNKHILILKRKLKFPGKRRNIYGTSAKDKKKYRVTYLKRWFNDAHSPPC